jgi:hypothetical protein
MSILGSIVSAIFGHGANTLQPSKPEGERPAATAAAGSSSGATAPTSSTAPSTSDAIPTQPAQTPQVDVEAVLTKLASLNSEKLDWRHSIVDLMKLLNLDSSISARKTLAHELHYTGNANDSAAMNVWLHKQVMIKLAENGGKVPDSLKV